MVMITHLYFILNIYLWKDLRVDFSIFFPSAQ